MSLFRELRTLSWHLVLAMSFPMASFSETVSAGGSWSPGELGKQAPLSRFRPLGIHRLFGGSGASKGKGARPARRFGLWHQEWLPFAEAIPRYLYDGAYLPTAYEVRGSEWKRDPNTGRESGLFRFYWQGVPLCDFYVKAHRFSDGEPMISGKLPPGSFLGLKDRLAALETWPEREEALQRAYELMGLPREHQDLVSAQVAQAERCYLSKSQEWQPVWDLTLRAGEGLYRVLADRRTAYRLERQFTGAAASLQSYEYNPRDGNLVTESVDLTGDGHLTSDLFTTAPQGGVARAEHPDLQFIVAEDDATFPEIASFAYLARMYEWFRILGYQWPGGQLTLKTHSVKLVSSDSGATSANVAHYVPASADQGSEIVLGDGDGQELQNLALDADITGHELGHQVVYEAVRSFGQVEEEEADPAGMEHSGAIHEGLADFFVYARTGNPCLGESVCPAGSSLCYEAGECLRRGDNNLVYRSEEYWSLPASDIERKGQLVAGLLWDIRSQPEVVTRDFDRLVLRALPFLTPKSTYASLLLALLTADYEFYEGAFACRIEAAAQARGLGPEIAELVDDCASFSPDFAKAVEARDEDAEKPEEEPQQAYTKRGVRLEAQTCGTVAGYPSAHPFLPSMLLCLLLALPFAVVFVSRQ